LQDTAAVAKNKYEVCINLTFKVNKIILKAKEAEGGPFLKRVRIRNET